MPGAGFIGTARSRRRRRSGAPAGPAVVLSGLSGGTAQPGTHTGITASLSDGTPVTAYKWGSSVGGSQFGTAAAPADFTTADGGLLFVELTGGGRSYFGFAPVRALVPVLTGPVALTGNAVSGNLLTGTPATFSGAGLSLTTAWQVSNTGTGGWSDTGDAGPVSPALVTGRYYRFAGTAQNSGGSVTGYSDVAGPVEAAEITATVLPASSPLVAGQALEDTADWALITQAANYATDADARSITAPVINFTGSTDSASEPLADGDTNAFSITVHDTGGTTRSFTVSPRTVVYAAPATTGALSDQSFATGTGLQNYDASANVTGEGLSFSVTAVPGVSVSAATGLVSFDTDLLAPQSGTTITVTAANSGGSVQSSFALTLTAPAVYASGISGLSSNPTYGQVAQIGTALTGTLSGLLGTEIVLPRWKAGGSVIPGATATGYMPPAGQDLAALQYAPTVDGTEVASASYTVRHAPPEAGSLAAVSTGHGSGAPLVNVAAGFTGSALSYAENVPWATLSGSTLTIDDTVRSDTVTITATNSGGQASVDLNVEITAPVVSVTSAIADQSLVQGTGDVTIDLRDVFANATGYSVAGAGAAIDGDGVTLRLDDATVRAAETVTVNGANAFNSSDDSFTLTVTAAATAPAQTGAPALVADSDTEITATLAAAPADGGSAITQYDLQISTDQSRWNTVPDIASPHVISGLAGSTAYFIRTRAVNAIGPGPWSVAATVATQSSVTVPAQMAAPALAVDGQTQITLVLADDPADGGSAIIRRDIRWRRVGDSWTVETDISGPLVLAGLIAGTEYEAEARVRNGVGNGPWSATAGVTTGAAPTGFTATRNGSDLVLSNVPDISPQSFTAELSGTDLVVTLTGTIYTPPPAQIAVIDAANHDGTDPDTGVYDISVFDLGSAQDNRWTLPGATVPQGAMTALIWPEQDVTGGAFDEFDRVVFVGASIMAQTFGSSLSTRNATAEAAFAASGAAVEVYSNATSGFDAGQVQGLLSEAMATFPEKTLFFVHAGGNNVTADRPWPGGETALSTGLNGLIDIAATRPGSVILSDLTFRDYDNATAGDEGAGAKPYNDAVLLPAFAARRADLLSRGYYADGTPVSCLYEWSSFNRAAYLSGDNIHPANPGGRDLLRGWLSERLAPLCLGLPAPAQVSRADLAPPSPDTDLFIQYGDATATGVNTLSGLPDIAASGVTGFGPFNLLNTDGSDPGVTLEIVFSGPAPGSNSGFGKNLAGRADGPAGFDGTLYNDVFTTDSFYTGAAYTSDHVLSGLKPDTPYTVRLIASRAAGDSRETLFTFSVGETATIQTTASPVAAPVTVSTVSDGTGRITITQSAVSGSWSYLGGLQLTET